MNFRLEMVDEVRDWLHQLRRFDRGTAILVGQAITALLDEGPALGRPLVDRIKGSSLHNLKELRPGSAGPVRSGSCSSSILLEAPSYL